MHKYFAIIPAAGSGVRFGSDHPKQYLPLLGRPLLHWALHTFSSCPAIERIWVVLAPEDDWWQRFDSRCFEAKLEILYQGGATRSASVVAGLQAAHTTLGPDDWVLVHDAARPCLSASLLQKLITEVGDDPVGGLLAVPVADTLKRDNGQGYVAQTLARAGLWQAQTPQMFRYRFLCDALRAHPDTTDEAGAIEAAGFSPRLVRSDSTNLKVTYPDDLLLATAVLLHRNT